jgi:DNA-binding transcriptional regulator LsrR (DeoR family)
MASNAAEIAKKLGLTEAQVNEVIASAGQQGTWTTTVNTIVRHSNGSRHWANQTCEQC